MKIFIQTGFQWKPKHFDFEYQNIQELVYCPERNMKIYKEYFEFDEKYENHVFTTQTFVHAQVHPYKTIQDITNKLDILFDVQSLFVPLEIINPLQSIMSQFECDVLMDEMILLATILEATQTEFQNCSLDSHTSLGLFQFFNKRLKCY